MKLFINKNKRLAALMGSVVYEYNFDPQTAESICRTWMRANPSDEFAVVTREQREAAKAIQSLIVASPRVANAHELRAKDSPVMRVLNR